VFPCVTAHLYINSQLPIRYYQARHGAATNVWRLLLCNGRSPTRGRRRTKAVGVEKLSSSFAGLPVQFVEPSSCVFLSGLLTQRERFLQKLWLSHPVQRETCRLDAVYKRMLK